jgi:hypothetical protein
MPGKVSSVRKILSTDLTRKVVLISMLSKLFFVDKFNIATCPPWSSLLVLFDVMVGKVFARNVGGGTTIVGNRMNPQIVTGKRNF